MSSTNTHTPPLRIGILGVGHLGKIHIKCLKLLPESYQIVGFYDPNDTQAEIAKTSYGIQRFADYQALLNAVDVVDIVTPTLTHAELALAAIDGGKHVFIEKPIAHTIAEAEEIIERAAKNGVKVQVGHVERFNPAFLSLQNKALDPMFIEGHRLATFNPRGTDVSVVLDLMIHDLDIILKVVKAEVKSVSASGVAVVSDTPDIANARIEFTNGCVANLTASRISLKQMRKIRLFQQDAYISLDFLKKESQIIRLTEAATSNASAFMQLETAQGLKNVVLDMPPVQENNAIQEELATFAQSIQSNSPVFVTAEDGKKALALAHLILKTINDNQLIQN